MSVRIVLYAEGGNELAGEFGTPPPGERLEAHHLGTAHILVRRCASTGKSIPLDAVNFVSPLRSRGRRAEGSHLLQRKRLRQLLAWPPTDRRPDLAIILVDEDEDPGRGSRIEQGLEGLSLPWVVGVARQEFESWLLGDAAAIRSVFPQARPAPNPEALPRTEAKRLLQEMIAADPQQRSPLDLRRDLARVINLQQLGRLRSFDAFSKRLLHAIP